MNIKKMRSEFEAAVREKFHVAMVDFDRAGDSYMNPVNDYMWWAWQQSRASLVIELPTCEYANAASEYSKGHRQGIRACCEAIQSTGVKVK